METEGHTETGPPVFLHLLRGGESVPSAPSPKGVLERYASTSLRGPCQWSRAPVQEYKIPDEHRPQQRNEEATLGSTDTLLKGHYAGLAGYSSNRQNCVTSGQGESPTTQNSCPLWLPEHLKLYH